ncbi:MAG: FAD-binding oxidoreductase [Cycloclasticus sp.]|uniref:FAD-dependent oxidoreductase n=1 Tax=Cycloclasticus sp. TaxID=2024830 RepID=UPI00257F2379|nr:FAD-binding oxidoreductase [Cycloclasticus sp.]MBV1898800.1 FAD-binding oxidoreductase [Cycloclasticus sp.]
MKNIIENLNGLLGADNVISASDQPTEYQFLTDRINNGEREVIAVVTPSNLEELKNLLVSSTDESYSLFNLLSPGEINTAPIPAKGAIVVIDLKKLNSIIEVNTQAAYALIEPGVSYAQLNEYLEANNIPFIVDFDKNSTQSVSGGISNRSYGYTPYGDHLMMQCGMEVMLANGRLIRTGMGAMPNSDSWQLFKYGFGPYIDGTFTQSSLGIITKVGIWLMPKAPAYRPFAIQLPNEAAMNQAVEIMRDMKINMLVPNTVTVASAKSDALQFSTEALEDIGNNDEAATKHQLGAWNMYGALYNMPANVDFLWQAINGAFSQIEGAKFLMPEETANNPIWAQREMKMDGKFNTINPNLSGYSSINVHFASPIDGDDAVKMQTLLESVNNPAELNIIGQFALTWRTMMTQLQVLYPTGDAEKLAQARQLTKQLIDDFSAQGYPTCLVDADMQEAVDAVSLDGLKTLKNRVKKALDPQSVFG